MKLVELGRMSDSDLQIVRDYVARNQFPRKTTTRQLLAHIDSIVAERDALREALEAILKLRQPYSAQAMRTMAAVALEKAERPE